MNKQIFRVEENPLVPSLRRTDTPIQTVIRDQHPVWIVEAESDLEAVELLIEDGRTNCKGTFLVTPLKEIGVTVMAHPSEDIPPKR